MSPGVRCFWLFFLVFIVPKCQSASFLEFFIGPSLDSSGIPHPKNTENIVNEFGYRLDTHLVASETGHILTLHRIPSGRKFWNGTREVALLHHGLFGCSDMWILRGPQHDLPYMLADSGFDVWLFNSRGNVYSRKHKFLDPDKDPKYWDFGIDDMGYYDLPSTIDYILNITQQKDLFFLGHSIGSSAGFITVTMRPEYNKKIKLFVALGPLTNVKHHLSPLHKGVFMMSLALADLVEAGKIYEILPRRLYFSKTIEMLCENGSPFQKLCLSAIFSIVGRDLKQFNTSSFPNFVKYYPSGTSLKVMRDVFHYYLSGEFARNNFRSSKLDFYNTSEPFLYNFSKVKVPVSLYFGESDFLVTEEDIDDLGSKLENLVGKFKIPDFNHLDFVLAMNAKGLLYEGLIHAMEKYKNR